MWISSRWAPKSSTKVWHPSSTSCKAKREEWRAHVNRKSKWKPEIAIYSLNSLELKVDLADRFTNEWNNVTTIKNMVVVVITKRSNR